MHLYFTTRGVKFWVDRFITELQGMYLPFKYQGKENSFRLQVRPLQIWEVVFPKEHKDLILNTIINPDGAYHKRHNKFILAIRKVLGIKPIPKYDRTKSMPITRANIDATGIGIKEDGVLDDKWKTEAL